MARNEGGRTGCTQSGCHSGNSRTWFKERADIIIKGELTETMERNGMNNEDLPSSSFKTLVKSWKEGGFK